MQQTWQLWSLYVNTVAEECNSMNSEMKELVFNLRFCLNLAVEIIVTATVPSSWSHCTSENAQKMKVKECSFSFQLRQILMLILAILWIAKRRLWVSPWNGWVASNLAAVSPLFVICCASCCCNAVWKSQNSSFIIIAAGWYFWILNAYLN